MSGRGLGKLGGNGVVWGVRGEENGEADFTMIMNRKEGSEVG